MATSLPGGGWRDLLEAGGHLRPEYFPPASILLVDDHPPNIVALEAILEPLQQRLVKAHSGEQALKELLLGDFAVILMDVQMPGLDGLRTAALIKERERTRHIPIIFLTAINRGAEQVFSGYSHGAVDFLVKPFDAEILRSKVSVFVELYQRGEQIKRQAALLRQQERERLNRKSEERLRVLMDLLPHPVWTLTSSGRVSYRNQAWSDYTGAAVQSMAELTEKVAHPDDREEVVNGWAQAQAEGRSFEMPYRLRRAQDGAYRWHLVRGEPERDEHHRIVGWILTATDIDAHKQAEEALRGISRAKDAFLAAASHELRTPLNVAMGQVRLAVMKLGDGGGSGTAHSLQLVQRNVDRMAKLVEDLLDVSRIETGRLALEPEPFDLTELLGEVRERMQVLSARHPLEVDSPASLPLVGDRGRVEQVVTNLIANAIRYSPNGGPIQVRAERSGEQVLLSVSDRGVGIPAEKQGTIFERFGQAHGARYGGLGLGLTIAQGIVAQHGGRIWVESTGVPTEGSTFHVELPVQPRAQ